MKTKQQKLSFNKKNPYLLCHLLLIGDSSEFLLLLSSSLLLRLQLSRNLQSLSQLSSLCLLRRFHFQCTSQLQGMLLRGHPTVFLDLDLQSMQKKKLLNL